MGKVASVLPSLQKSNQRLLGSAKANLDYLQTTEKRIAERLADPAYDHAANREALNTLAEQASEQERVLEAEIEIRKQLDVALKNNDKVAITAAREALKTHRAENKTEYGTSNSVQVCQKCMNRALSHLHQVKKPGSVPAMVDLITGVFEGREPDYCAIADSSTDAGGLSYGKHQAAEKKGGLYTMLNNYVNCKDPEPTPAIKDKLADQLDKFSKNHTAYEGDAADRASFKTALREACTDPAMIKTQDDFFASGYMAPAMDSADELCIKSPLGKAMLYDMAIQSGPGRINTLAPKAMKKLGAKADAGCSPCDPDGPSETDFLKALNDKRRAYVTKLGGDAAKSTYREDFFDDQLAAGNTNLGQDFVIRGIPVKGLP